MADLFRLRLRQACVLFGLHSSVYYWQEKRKDDSGIIRKLSALEEALSISIKMNTSMPGELLIRELNELVAWQGKADKVRLNKGHGPATSALT